MRMGLFYGLMSHWKTALAPWFFLVLFSYTLILFRCLACSETGRLWNGLTTGGVAGFAVFGCFLLCHRLLLLAFISMSYGYSLYFRGLIYMRGKSRLNRVCDHLETLSEPYRCYWLPLAFILIKRKGGGFKSAKYRRGLLFGRWSLAHSCLDLGFPPRTLVRGVASP